MGKCTRKCGKEELPATEVKQAVGIRTRSRAKKAAAEKSTTAAAEAVAEMEAGKADYLQLRSRRLSMAPRVVRAGNSRRTRRPKLAAEPRPPPPLLSRCSSNASFLYATADQGVMGRARSVGDEEAGDVESSFSNPESESRRRETTPISALRVELTDPVVNDHGKPATPKPSPSPPANEIEEFFSAAEKAEAERFMAKYNFDITNESPIPGGRFDWVRVGN